MTRWCIPLWLPLALAACEVEGEGGENAGGEAGYGAGDMNGGGNDGGGGTLPPDATDPRGCFLDYEHASPGNRDSQQENRGDFMYPGSDCRARKNRNHFTEAA